MVLGCEHFLYYMYSYFMLSEKKKNSIDSHSTNDLAYYQNNRAKFTGGNLHKFWLFSISARPLKPAVLVIAACLYQLPSYFKIAFNVVIYQASAGITYYCSCFPPWSF